MTAVHLEPAAHQQDVSASVIRNHFAVPVRLKGFTCERWLQREIAGDSDQSTAWQDETISSRQFNGAARARARQRQPAAAGDDGVAFDAPCKIVQLQGPVASSVEACRDVVARLQEREDFRKGVHRHDREENGDEHV